MVNAKDLEKARIAETKTIDKIIHNVKTNLILLEYERKIVSNQEMSTDFKLLTLREGVVCTLIDVVNASHDTTTGVVTYRDELKQCITTVVKLAYEIGRYCANHGEVMLQTPPLSITGMNSDVNNIIRKIKEVNDNIECTRGHIIIDNLTKLFYVVSSTFAETKKYNEYAKRSEVAVTLVNEASNIVEFAIHTAYRAGYHSV